MLLKGYRTNISVIVGATSKKGSRMREQNPTLTSPPSGEMGSTIKILNTQMVVNPDFFGNLLALWAGMSWLASRKHPAWSWLARLSAGALSAAALVLADVGHALAHTVSACYSGAPMDEIQLSSGMPRTIYYDDDISPRAHRMRALGGPVFSAFGLLISLLVRISFPRNSMARYVANWSSIGHGLILAGSLAPLPIVDGGSILKWTLVDRGRTPKQADQIVKQAGIVTGFTATAVGAGLATRQRWLPAVGLLAAGVIAIGAALGKIR
jgi:hypothetical protein